LYTYRQAEEALGLAAADREALSNPVLYAQRKGQWLARVQASPKDVDVLEQAADFLTVLDRPLAINLLERARDLEPNNARWLQRLGHLHRLNAHSGNQTEAKLALSFMERAYAMDRANQSTLTDLTEIAYDAGDMAKARAYAHQLLDEAGSQRSNWNYGNAVHKGNLVLGRIAVREGRLDVAATFLRASGETPGSPQLNTFGPNMSLARDLLERGQIEPVLTYFELCRKFWEMGGSRLDAWSKDVRSGKIPDFGANLVY
jgi:tetratricopeptide (TPR) repeat protein